MAHLHRLAIAAITLFSSLAINAAETTTSLLTETQTKAEAKACSATRVFYAKDTNDNELKYEFTIDAQGRVTSRTAYLKSIITDKWMPMSAFNVSYSQTETILTFAEYNRKKKAFTDNRQEMRYNADSCPEIIKLPSSCK